MKNGKPIDLQTRLERLEADVKEIKAMLQAQHEPKKPWWENMVGVFANDSVYEQIIKLGLEVREKDRRKVRMNAEKPPTLETDRRRNLRGRAHGGKDPDTLMQVRRLIEQ